MNGSLAASDCTSLVLDSLSFYADRYTFTGTAGQLVAISLTSSAFDPYLYLIGPDGSVLDEDDDGGTGVAIGLAVHGKTDGTQTSEMIANPDGTSRPIDLGPPGEVVVLVLYGSGIRGRSSLSAVTATIGGVNAEVQYAGAQPDFVGLDQINVLVPRSLIGRGEVDIVLTVDGKAANTVRVNIK